MARTYKRDKIGRFASSGYSGQSAGRGARLMASGSRDGGGAKASKQGSSSKLRKPAGTGAATPSEPVVNRTRAQAAKAQRARNAGRVLTAQNAPSRSWLLEGGYSVGSMKIRRGKSSQGNLLTGGVDSVRSGRRITQSSRSALLRNRR